VPVQGCTLLFTYILDYSPFFSDMMATLLKEELSSIWDSCEGAVFPTDIYSSQIAVWALKHKVQREPQ
jgi:hypothetical protein